MGLDAPRNSVRYQGRPVPRIARDHRYDLLDKTGTLTYGTPEVVDVRPAEGVPVASLLQAAVTAESRSEHPVAKAILKKASNMGISGEEPEKFDYTPGKGIVAARRGMEIVVGNRLFLEGHRIALPTNTFSQTDSEIFVAQEGKFLGTLVVADTLRPEATKAIQDLKLMGLKTVLLTGDSKAVAEDIGGKLGVDEIAAELLPEDKLDSLAGSSRRATTSSWWVTESMTLLPL